MSSLIQSHAGENKRASNYPLGVWVGRLQFASDERTAGRDSGSRKERRRAWFMKEINSELPPSGYEIGAGIRFLIVRRAMVRVIIHTAARRVSKQKAGSQASARPCLQGRERGQISNA